MKVFPLIIIIVLAFITCQRAERESRSDRDPDFVDLFSSAADSTVACFRIPSIITAPNGDIVAACDERVSSCGDLRSNDDINIIIRRSSDNGESWSEIETVVDYPRGKSASDPSMIVDEISGEIFLFFNFMDLENHKGIYFLRYIKSDDNGQTWSQPADITEQVSRPEWYNDFKFITSGRGIQTSSGSLVHTLVSLERGLHLFASDDHGDSWHLIDGPSLQGDESKVVELADGGWMVNSRVNGAGYRYVHRSYDKGLSWQSGPDSALKDPGCNASIIRYNSSKEGEKISSLLFSNANMSGERSNMTVRISYDEGKSWSAGRTVYAGSSAYSSLTVLPDGSIGLLFEKDDYSEIVFAKLTPDWIADGKDNAVKRRNKPNKKLLEW